MSSFKLDFDDLPDELARKLPRYDGVPAAPIGRLARDSRVRGKGVGELLVADAVRRILNAAQSLAVFAIMVDAKDERAATFYEGFGFRRFPLHPNRLFLLASMAIAALEKM
ncbi:MAG: GNAT family N-acetyltransferase [Gemmataceae bacterium]